MMNDKEMKDLIKRLVRNKASDEVFGAIESWLIDYGYSDEWEDTVTVDLGSMEPDGQGGWKPSPPAELHRWMVWVHEEQDRVAR